MRDLVEPLLVSIPGSERRYPLILLRNVLIPLSCAVLVLLLLAIACSEATTDPLHMDSLEIGLPTSQIISVHSPGVNMSGVPLAPRTVVLTFFEPEFAPWQEAAAVHAALELKFSSSGWPLLYFEDLKLVVACTGMGPRRASAVVTALGHDARLNLRESLWLVAGVAGIDPLSGTVGDVAVASYITDMAAAYYIDRAEEGFPPEWETPWIPLTCTAPFCDGVGSEAEAHSDQLSFTLEPELVSWAVDVTKHVELTDSNELVTVRAPFAVAGFKAAARAPQVIRGDTLSGHTVWVGFVATRWARKWVPYWTNGKGTFVTSAMEDSGVATALAMLGKGQHADPKRLLSLRAAANFCTQPPDVSIAAFVSEFAAADSNETGRGKFWQPGFDPVTLQAAQNVFQVALAVVKAVAGSAMQPPFRS